jgi:Transposase DDE domain group 1
MAIACGYEDANDAARLASDPVHKLLVGRDPVEGEDLASQPTLSRFENSAGRKELFRMGEVLADTVIERHRKRLHGRARRITIDLDPTDDPSTRTCDCLGKLFRDTTPATTGASAAGICGSFALATHLAVHLVIPDRDSKCRSRSPFTRCKLFRSEPLALEPLRHGTNVGVRRAELLWRQPNVIIRRTLVLLLFHVGLKCGLLVGAALEQQQDASHRQPAVRGSAVKFRPREWMHITPKHHSPRVVHGVHHARSCLPKHACCVSQGAPG